MDEHVSLIIVAIIGLAGAIGSNLVNIFASRGKNEIDIVLEGSNIISNLQRQVGELSDRLSEGRAQIYELEDTVKKLNETIEIQEASHKMEIKQIRSDYERQIRNLKSLLNQYADRIRELENGGKGVNDGKPRTKNN